MSRVQGIGKFEVPRITLARKVFAGNTGKLEGEILRINARLDSFLSKNHSAEDAVSFLEKTYAQLLSAAKNAGIEQANINDFTAKRPNLSNLMFKALFRISDEMALNLETEKGLAFLIPFIAVSNGDVSVYDPNKAADLQPIAKRECGYSIAQSGSWAQERYEELTAGLYDPSNACLGVQACENPIELDYFLKPQREEKSGNILLSGETPAGKKSCCYETGIGETATTVRPYLESPFTRGIQEEFSKVAVMSEVHFHPKGEKGAVGDEYPSHLDLAHLLQQAILYKGLGYPKDAFAMRVVTNTGVFTLKPDFEKINDDLENAAKWVTDYAQILIKYLEEGLKPANISQAEMSARFAEEITAKLLPYIEMKFEPLEPEKRP